MPWRFHFILPVLWLAGCSSSNVAGLGHSWVQAVSQRDSASLSQLYHPQLRACAENNVRMVQASGLPSGEPKVQVYELPEDQRKKSAEAGLPVEQRWLIVLAWEAQQRQIQLPAGEYEGKPVLLVDCLQRR